ncbi:MAG: signal peptidase II [Ruminococcaceae bacterium]|nr:signal peptidase II [Oscillospiraceae bacterium]
MFYIIGSVLLIFIDQITKFLVEKNIPLYAEIPVIKNVISLSYVQNTGAAWGIFSNGTFYLTLFTIVLLSVGAVFIIKNKIKDVWFNISMMLIYAGAIGNLIDRLFRNGAVVDMIKTDFIDFPVFNFADCCVVVGAICLSVFILFKYDDKEN